MRPRNFPGRVLRRRMRALDRLQPPWQARSPREPDEAWVLMRRIQAAGQPVPKDITHRPGRAARDARGLELIKKD